MVRIFRDLVPSWAEGGYELGVWEYVSDLVKSFQTVPSPNQPSDQQQHLEEKEYAEHNAVYYEVNISFNLKDTLYKLFVCQIFHNKII